MKNKERFVFDILLFLGFFGFLARGTYVLLVAFIFCIMISRLKPLNLSATFVLLLVFVLCDLLYTIYEKGPSIRHLITPIATILAFQCGSWVIRRDNLNTDYVHYCYLIALATASHGIANMVLNIRKYGMELSGERVLEDLWKTEDTLATGQGALFVFLVGVSYYIYSSGLKGSKGIFKCILVAFPVISVIYNVMTATRFCVFAFVISVIGLYIIESVFVKKSFKNIVIGLCVFCAIFLLIQYNVFGLSDMIQETALFERIERLEENEIDTAFTSTGRQEQMKYVIDNFSMFVYGGYPAGWSFVHNTWLSLLNRGGIFLFIPFIIFTIATVVVSIRFMKKAKNGVMFLTLGFLIVTYSYFFIEPVFESCKWMFFGLVFIVGMMDSINKINYRKRV